MRAQNRGNRFFSRRGGSCRGDGPLAFKRTMKIDIRIKWKTCENRDARSKAPSSISDRQDRRVSSEITSLFFFSEGLLVTTAIHQEALKDVVKPELDKFAD